MTRFFYATALTAVTGAFIAWLFAVLFDLPTTAAVGWVLFGFAVTMAIAGALSEHPWEER